MPKDDYGKEKQKKMIGEIDGQEGSRELLANQIGTKKAFQSKNPRQMTPNPFYHA